MEAPDLKPLSEAADLAEFKKLRQEARPKPEGQEPETPAQAEEATPAPSAAEAGTAEPVSQESKPAEKSIDDQIKELRAKNQHAKANKLEREAGAAEARRQHEAELTRLRQEMEALRRPPSERPAAEPAKAEPAQAAADPNDPEPKPTDDKYAGAHGYETYLRDLGKWDRRQEQKAEQAQQAQRTVIDARRAKVTAATAKYPDFATVTAADAAAGTGLVLTPAMIQYFDAAETGADVLYHLGKNPADYQRIRSLDPVSQLLELGYIGKLISTPAANTVPEKKTPAVTRVAPPPRVLNGNDTPPPKALSEASSYDEFKQLRRQRRTA